MEGVGGLVDLVLDGGRTAGGKPSTVVDVSRGEPKVLREGAVPAREILKRVFNLSTKER
jgi:L-threonylcarbamoyladenylate synthase